LVIGVIFLFFKTPLGYWGFFISPKFFPSLPWLLQTDSRNFIPENHIKNPLGYWGTEKERGYFTEVIMGLRTERGDP